MKRYFSLNLLCALMSLFSFSNTMIGKYQADDSGECTICLDPLKSSTSKLSVLPACNHLFHSECIAQYQGNKCSFLCPNCRAEHKGAIPLYAEQKQPSAPQQSSLEDADTQRAILASIKDEEARKNRVKEEEKQKALAEKLLIEQAKQNSRQTDRQEQEQRQLAAAQKASLQTLRADENARQLRAAEERARERLAVEQAKANSEKTAQQEQQKRDEQSFWAFWTALGQALFGK